MSDTPDGTLAHATAAAEAIRGLNHATLGQDGLGQPSDACAVLGELSLAASRIPQLLGQVGRWLASALAHGRLGCDDGTDPAAAVSGAWLFISDARAQITQICGHRRRRRHTPAGGAIGRLLALRLQVRALHSVMKSLARVQVAARDLGDQAVAASGRPRKGVCGRPVCSSLPSAEGEDPERQASDRPVRNRRKPS